MVDCDHVGHSGKEEVGAIDLLSLLPASLLMNYVLPCLTPDDVMRLASCSRGLREVAFQEELWRPRCEALGWGPFPRGVSWRAGFSSRRKMLCVECGTPSRYVFALLSCRLCEACEHQSPRYALVTALEAAERYGVAYAALAALPYHEACRTRFYLRTAVEVLPRGGAAAGGGQLAAAEVASGSGGEEEGAGDGDEEHEGDDGHEEDDDDEVEDVREDVGGGEGSASGGDDGGEEGAAAVTTAAAAARRAAEKATRKAAKKAAKEAQRLKRQERHGTGGSGGSGSARMGTMSYGSRAVVHGTSPGGGRGAGPVLGRAGCGGGRGGGSGGGGRQQSQPPPPQQQPRSGGRAAGGTHRGGREGPAGPSGSRPSSSRATGLSPAGPVLVSDDDDGRGGGVVLPLEGQTVPPSRSRGRGGKGGARGGAGGGGGGGGGVSRRPSVKLKSGWAAEREALMAAWGQFGISGLVLQAD